MFKKMVVLFGLLLIAALVYGVWRVFFAPFCVSPETMFQSLVCQPIPKDISVIKHGGKMYGFGEGTWCILFEGSTETVNNVMSRIGFEPDSGTNSASALASFTRAYRILMGENLALTTNAVLFMPAADSPGSQGTAIVDSSTESSKRVVYFIESF